MSSPAQITLFHFEEPKPKPSPKTARLMDLAASLGAIVVKEPQPAERGMSWKDDAQISQPHFRREFQDPELSDFDE
ncbi:MAG TPA: hypothetical protein VN455_05450 [Methanotrichaceae archaeon]|nr:hypothetical protein [Methanotrichaceae archaeon]